jgi:predicted enzyme related to lactoylglutathione lyase
LEFSLIWAHTFYGKVRATILARVETMRRRTFINLTAGTAAAVTFPPLVQPETPKHKNPVGPKPSDLRTGDAPMTHPVVHFEIGCRDSAKTQEFYKKLFDWKMSDMGPAAMIAAEARGIGGHINSLGHDPYLYTIFYVSVDDVAAYLKKAEGLGAKTLVPPVDIPTGTFAWMQDLEGNTVGLWKNKP